MFLTEKYCANMTDDEALDREGRYITDSKLWFYHQKMLPYLRVLTVEHVSYQSDDSKKLVLREGKIVTHRDAAEDFAAFFKGFLELDKPFPIAQAVPIAHKHYRHNDGRSMAENNSHVQRTSLIGGRTPSEHLRGTAGDFNALDAPMIMPDYTIVPAEAIGRQPPHLDMIIKRRPDVIALFHSLGYEVGAYWDDPSHPDDYYGEKNGELVPILNDGHHIEKRPHLLDQIEVPTGIWTPPAWVL